MFLVLISTILFFSISTTTWAAHLNSSTTTTTVDVDTHLSSIRSVCKSTPFPDVCFDSLKLSVSININPNVITYVLQTLQLAISQAAKLSDVLSHVGSSDIVEKQRGTIQDCVELHQITMSSLQRSMSRIRSGDSRKLSDAKTFLSAALTNKNTCLEGLDSASGPLKTSLVNSLISTYKHVGNSLSMLSSQSSSIPPLNRRRLMGFPTWIMSPKNTRILYDDPTSQELTVAADGTGNFTTINDAINFAPNNSYDRVIIYVREGVYEENVEIPIYKTNIVLLGDGSDVTVITGSRSVAAGWTTFRSATVAVSGEGFLARDITFENTAGPENHQAVALRINADLSALYLCVVNGYQDTLYAHSFRQFYRECDISGTVDYIFGNGAAVFQACNIIARLPMPGQYIAITAQSRDLPEEYTGFSIQNCSILASDDFYASNMSVKSYLGRPWREYSRTVYLQSYIDDLIDPAGWKEWSGDAGHGLDTLYYGEYDNSGPGSVTDNRVNWFGYHIMDYYDASNFTVSHFITGDEWLGSTSFPYDDGV
ncbi:Pectinesterase [Thalictrum thalictroides]|uniref:Pectinesterase n=1 Tax=Thalictrum thalictroides TaxID=46969 RepID=A0A7J6VTV1_THATH|nr:Pectinesterase [Thalictrum thalictroides]